MALPVYQQDKYPFLYQHNDAPILGTEMLEEWSNEVKVHEDKPITVTYNKRDSAYWREIAFGVGEGERNKTLASLTGYLLRRYVDANLFMDW